VDPNANAIQDEIQEENMDPKANETQEEVQ